MVVEVGKGKEVKRKEGADLYSKKENQENWSGQIVEREGGKEGWRRLSFFVLKSLFFPPQNQNTKRQPFLEHVSVIERYCSLVHF